MQNLMRTCCSILFSILSLFYSLLGKAQSENSDQFIKSEKYQKAIDIIVSDSNLDSLRREKIAFCYMKLGQYSKANEIYNQILIDKPQSSEILMQLVSVNEKLGNVKNTIKYYQRLIDLDSVNSYYLREFAKLALKSNQTAKGLQYLKKALIVNPDDLESNIEIANIYLNSADDEQAEPYIKKVIQIDSNSVK
jgi:tetratricopeptide (TPR) repeat protein